VHRRGQSLLQRLVARLVPDLSDDDLDGLMLAVQLERARRRQLRRKHPERIHGA
jgi:hypothetical protein